MRLRVTEDSFQSPEVVFHAVLSECVLFFVLFFFSLLVPYGLYHMMGDLECPFCCFLMHVSVWYMDDFITSSFSKQI